MLFRDLIRHDTNARVRPVLTAYMVLDFKAFGGNGPAHGVMGAALLGAAVVFLYLVLRELNMERPVALAIAAVYGMLPHDSVIRFWFMSQQAIISIVFALAGIYAMLRSIRPAVRYSGLWIAVSLGCFILSFLSYEVGVGLIAASIAGIVWRRYREARLSGRGLRTLAGIGVMVVVLLIVGVFKMRMQDRIVYHHHLLRFLGRLGAMAAHTGAQALKFNFWAYLLRMPWVIAHMWQHSALGATATAVAVAIACAVAAYLWRIMGPGDTLNRRSCLLLMAAGLVVFLLGILLFMRDLTWDYAAPGEGDRISVAAALGAALILVALVGLFSSIWKRPSIRILTFSILVGLACGLNSLAVSGIGYYWDDAAAKQKVILQSIRANVRGLPQNSVLLLDGFCRYSGSGPVFETDWDASGAVDVTLGDYSLHSDVISRNAHFGATAVDTTMYAGPEGHYPYAEHLFVYNVKTQTLQRLDSQQAALTYLRTMNPTGDSGCPPADDGGGVEVF